MSLCLSFQAVDREKGKGKKGKKGKKSGKKSGKKKKKKKSGKKSGKKGKKGKKEKDLTPDRYGQSKLVAQLKLFRLCCFWKKKKSFFNLCMRNCKEAL